MNNDDIKTNAEWLEWGKRDPFFGVASWEGKEAQGPSPWTPEEFYALGKLDWQDFEKHWSAYGYRNGTFVEVGCGAGRITKQLASAFSRGHAVDISAEMVARAQMHIAADDVTWHITAGGVLPLKDGQVDAAFSCHVFQHLPSAAYGIQYFREIFRVLNSGGSFMIHLPLFCFPNSNRLFSLVCGELYTRVALPWNSFKWSRLRSLMMNRGGTPPMPYLCYDQPQLSTALKAIGFNRIEFATFELTSNSAPHSFVFGTKS